MPNQRFMIHCPIYNHDLVLSPRMAELLIEASGDQLVRIMSKVTSTCRELPGSHGAQWCESSSTLHMREQENNTDIDWDLRVNFRTAKAELVEINERQHYRSVPRVCKVQVH